MFEVLKDENMKKGVTKRTSDYLIERIMKANYTISKFII